jgi:hypothetical protein
MTHPPSAPSAEGMGESLSPPLPLTLFDLPDYLLRRILQSQPGSYGPQRVKLKGVLAFASCCRRFHRIVCEGGVVPELHVFILDSATPADPDYRADHLGLFRTLGPQCITVR